MTISSKTLYGDTMSKDLERLNQLIKERYKDYPRGHTLDDPREWALKAVYRDIMGGFRNLKEAKEYVEGLEDDRVIYTALGHEIRFSLIKNIIAHIERNPFYSPWTGGLEEIPLVIPFIQIGDRVRKIGPGKYRYQRWPSGKWLEAGVTGTVIEFHRALPDYKIKGQYFPGYPPYAVVEWDLGGKAATIIQALDEGKTWERVNHQAVPMTQFNRGDDLLQYYKVPPSAD